MSDERKLAQASVLAGGVPPFGENYGTFYMPYGGGTLGNYLGTSPEKLIVPKEYHTVARMCYDFYQRGGMVSTIINRLAEFTVTEIRNGQRETTDEMNTYFEAIMNEQPSRMLRFLRTAALEYLLSGMVLPRVDWVPKTGKEVHPKLKPNKTYYFPQCDLYPPLLVEAKWAGWGTKTYWLKLPDKDVRLIRSGGGRIKENQAKYQAWEKNYPSFVQDIKNGSDSIQIKDVDPILRKEISVSPYPTPYLFPVLEPLIFKQHLRRMDFAVAARVINAILLVQEGDKDFPLTDENQGNLTELKNQIAGRAGNPALMERLFFLFSNHTTKLTWIQPDVQAMLNQEKYVEVNKELAEGMGFTSVLLTGESRQAQASEISTYAIQPQMEEFRSMALEWLIGVYRKGADLNNFSMQKLPAPTWKPIRLQDFVKTAATFAQAFKEGNISRTTRAESVGTDFETETELMRDEAQLMKGLPAYQPTPYSPPPPIMGAGGPGRPAGSQNVPINNRNSGVKPPGQSPTSKIAASLEEELWDDERVIELIDTIAQERGIIITPDDVIDNE